MKQKSEFGLIVNDRSVFDCYPVLSPNLPFSKTYEEILNILKEYLCKRISILTEHHKLFCEKQIQGESINSYVTALKELFKRAKFKCDNLECSKLVINILLTAQFVRDLSSSETCERILQQSDIYFEENLETALVIEALK